MEELIRGILARHPEFAAKVRGVSEEDLVKLEKCTGPLPPDYRAFLTAMGRGGFEDLGLGEREFGFDAVFKNHYANANYDKRKSAKDPKYRKRIARERDARLLIGWDADSQDPHNVYIDRAKPELPVFEDSECCGRKELSPSLREFLLKGWI